MQAPARLSQPTMPPTPMTLACRRSSAVLAAIRRQNKPTIQPRPTTAPVSPMAASRACTWPPVTHKPQLAASSTSGARNCGASRARTPSHLGPAVNRKPVKNRGMNPKVMTVACTSDGDTAYERFSSALARSTCTSAHQPPVNTRTPMARKNPSRCGASSRCRQRQAGSGAGAVFPGTARVAGRIGIDARVLTHRSRGARTACSNRSRPCGSRHGRRIRCTSCPPSRAASGPGCRTGRDGDRCPVRRADWPGGR
jgi:hypothetical protein